MVSGRVSCTVEVLNVWRSLEGSRSLLVLSRSPSSVFYRGLKEVRVKKRETRGLWDTGRYTSPGNK